MFGDDYSEEYYFKEYDYTDEHMDCKQQNT